MYIIKSCHALSLVQTDIRYYVEGVSRPQESRVNIDIDTSNIVIYFFFFFFLIVQVTSQKFRREIKFKCVQLTWNSRYSINLD